MAMSLMSQAVVCLLGSDIDEIFEARNRSALLALVFVFEFGKLVG